MKQFNVALLILFISTSFGQIHVGRDSVKTTKPKPIKKENLDLLKKTTTIFLYRDSDAKNLENFKKTISESWSYTPLEFMSFKKYVATELKGNYSFFTIGGKQVESTNYTSTRLYLNLWMKVGSETVSFSRMELYTDFPTYQKAEKYIGNENFKMMQYLYTEANIYNWHIPFIKNSLQYVNKKLNKNETRWLFEAKINHPDLKNIKANTLFIPDYTLVKFHAFSGDESKRHNIEKLMKRYPYKYKVVSVNELNKIITDSKEPVYYLSYIKSSTDKFVNIIEGKSGDIIYSKYTPISYNIKDKDIIRIISASK